MEILVNSRIHICFHEAGHIEAAYLSGATVSEVVSDAAGNPCTSVIHKPDLSTKEPVACGGYAAESILFYLGRLIDQSGEPLTEQAFKRQAMHNARLDKFPFYIKKPFDHSLGMYPESPFQPIDEWWPQESDAPFIAYADQYIVPALKERIVVIEALALELDRLGQLNQYEIENIRRSSSSGSDA